MRKSKFTDSQIMDAVKRVEAGFGVPDICREMGISTATFPSDSFVKIETQKATACEGLVNQ